MIDQSERTEESSSRPLFVVGYMHSGTTLLQNILIKNSRVYSSRGETKFFEYFSMIAQRFPDVGPETRLDFVVFCLNLIRRGFTVAWKAAGQEVLPGSYEELAKTSRHLESGLPSESDHVEIFARTFRYLAAREGATRWLEKTPTHVFHVERIASSLPDAFFVEVVRDARDVLASKKTRRQTVWTERYTPEQQPLKHLEKAYDPIWDCLSWQSAIRAGRSGSAIAPDRFLTLRYEDLVREPETAVRRICGALQMDFEASMLVEVPWSNPADWRRRDQRAGIRADSIGRWSQNLTHGELAMCQFLVGRDLRRLGYDLQPAGALSGFTSVFLLVKAVIDVPVRLYRKGRLGGPRLLAVFLRNYWNRFLNLTAREGR
ncbi:hypothetical protein BH18GEM1_BH18GEM1_06940 [soil metagenome]